MNVLDPRCVQAAAIASALRLYAKTRIQVNRAYTPIAMLRTAQRITGRVYARGQYLEAAADLKAWINARAVDNHSKM